MMTKTGVCEGEGAPPTAKQAADIPKVGNDLLSQMATKAASTKDDKDRNKDEKTCSPAAKAK